MLSFWSLLISLRFRIGNVSLWHWLSTYLFGVASVGQAARVLEVARHCSPGVRRPAT